MNRLFATRSERPLMPARLLPVELLMARRPHRILERYLMLARSGTWVIFVTGFFEPLLFLLSVRVGFGALVGEVVDDGQVVDYVNFVAPALMAAAAMNGATFESTMNVFHQMKYERVFHSALATPITVGDLALGIAGYAALRGGVYSAAFIVTMFALGLVTSPLLLLTLPVCVLISFAFASVGLLSTTVMRSWADFEYVPTALLPMFLFSATFFPLEGYGEWAWFANLSPLYHGVVVVRELSYGELHWSHLGHLGVLAAMTVVGLSVAARRMKRLLMP